jgi:chaperonin GroES
MKLKPISDRLVVKQAEAETKTASGLYLPESAKEKPTQGKVLAVGPGKLGEDGKRHEVGVKAGEVVYYSKWAGTEVTVDGEKLVILNESDVLGVID